MERSSESATHKRIGRGIGIGTVSAAVLLLFVTLHQTNSQPRTDDASVRANFIQIVAEVDGRVVDLPVKDNQLVKKGGSCLPLIPDRINMLCGKRLPTRTTLSRRLSMSNVRLQPRTVL
jgi:hypothetical protein